MLVALLSNVHGNRAALAAVLARIERLQPDLTFILGDLVGRGPEPEAVLKLARRNNTYRIRGNWEDWLESNEAFEEHPRRREWLDANRRSLGNKGLKELLDVPRTRRVIVHGTTIVLAHDIPLDSGEPLSAATPLERLEQIATETKAEVIAVGGRREPFVRQVKGALVVNVGSVGLPAGGDPRACVALLYPEQPPRVELVRVPYPIDRNTARIRRQVQKGVLADETASRYYKSLLSGKHHASLDIQTEDDNDTLLIELLVPHIRAVYADGPILGRERAPKIKSFRVRARRLREAIRMAQPLLEPGLGARVLRRAQLLGDVLAARRHADALGRELAGLEAVSVEERALVERLRTLVETRQRRTAQRIAARYPEARLLAHGVDALALTARPQRYPPAFEEVVTHHVTRAVERASRLLSTLDDEGLAEAHHRLRIALRKVRYQAEILGTALPELAQTDVISACRAMQAPLGALHDLDDLIDFLETRRAARTAGSPLERSPALESLLGRCRARRHDLFMAARSAVAEHGPRVFDRLPEVLCNLER